MWLWRQSDGKYGEEIRDVVLGRLVVVRVVVVAVADEARGSAHRDVTFATPAIDSSHHIYIILKVRNR